MLVTAVLASALAIVGWQAAYAFASPEIKSVFPDAERFFDMVKKTYAPVFKPGNYAFGRNQISKDGTVAFQ